MRILSGECETITVNGQPVSICGVDDPAIDRAEGQRIFLEQLDRVGAAEKDGAFALLLAHRPEFAETYAAYEFDLTLCGHAHGGQWRIPGIQNGLYAPDQGLFPKYAGGMYALDHMTMIVSRGLARESTRVPRIFNRPELVIVEIDPGYIQ